MQLLTLNAGSSSLKLALYEGTTDRPRMRARGLVDVGPGRIRLRTLDPAGRATGERQLERDGPMDPAVGAVAWLGDALTDLARTGGEIAPSAIGHRVVMGGVRFDAPFLLDEESLTALVSLSPLAPLHQPMTIAGIRETMSAFPGVPQVACPDTAFHRSHPWVHDTYALPRDYFDAGVRRFGFHGLSYEFVAAELARVAPDLAAGRVVVAHLGSGASLCALRDGGPVASTMGFSTLDGLPMGTRSGQIDPGVLLWMLQSRGMDAAAITALLYGRSGLRGLSGTSSDLRELEASADPDAARAIDYFCERIAMAVGELAVTLRGLDALVFTAGIGENSARVRREVVDRLGFLGLALDDDVHRTDRDGARRISPAGDPRPQVWVVPTDEEQVIAGHAARLTAKLPTCG